MKRLIIGTAGHVDHGKTQLVKALTGIDTDRLKEEKERGISIELGFAFLDLPGGRRAGIVDVPGHERFIKNMLAGAGGMDMVILVVAADEGVMPQTREHLDIIQLLQIRHGAVALTKTDLVDDEWLSMIKEEVREFLKGTVLEGAPVIEVSSVTGKGVQELKDELSRLADKVEQRSAGGPVRLPVDRVFSVTGFGTVVTGTLISGTAAVGDPVEVMPRGLDSRIRNIHVHGKKVEKAEAGQRVAVNITGLEVEQVPRGSVVATPGYLKPTYRLDVRLILLRGAKTLKNRARVRIYLGTAEIFGRVRLLDRDELDPGQWAYAQLELEEQAVAVRGDRFVIRSYSPMRTIGGGSIIDTGAGKHRRFRKDVLESISTKERGTPGDLVRQVLNGRPAMMTAAEIARAAGLADQDTGETLAELVREGEVRRVSGDGPDYYLSGELYRRWSDEVRRLAGNYHREFPLREGYPKEELRSRKFGELNSRQFQLLLQSLEADGTIRSGPKTISEPSFVPGAGTEIKGKLSLIESKYRDSAMQPPAWNDAAGEAGIEQPLAGEVLHFLIRQGVLVKAAEDLYFHASALKEAREKLAQYFSTKNEITVGEARDIFNTSRKYALPLLEYFDREKITRRVGDLRVPGIKLKG
ncbi:MAG: selenocysteine-specific translation elongation factor [Peptococcaceae bacterium]|nr:selenocysteine-specific translation elongation factor [Peptococcaceae bacterium]